MTNPPNPPSRDTHPVVKFSPAIQVFGYTARAAHNLPIGTPPAAEQPAFTIMHIHQFHNPAGLEVRKLCAMTCRESLPESAFRKSISGVDPLQVKHIGVHCHLLEQRYRAAQITCRSLRRSIGLLHASSDALGRVPLRTKTESDGHIPVGQWNIQDFRLHIPSREDTVFIKSKKRKGCTSDLHTFRYTRKPALQ